MIARQALLLAQRKNGIDTLQRGPVLGVVIGADDAATCGQRQWLDDDRVIDRKRCRGCGCDFDQLE